jgi:acetyl-CoA C-acetyltransferase
MPKSVILSTARTPFAKMGGALASMGAPELGGTAIAGALERSEVDPGQVDSVVYGQVLQAGQGQIPSRQAQIKGGIPKEVPSETINKVCASGMRSVGLLDQAIRAGDISVGVGGGMESMSNAPYLLPGARFGFRMGDMTSVDSMTHDGLTNPFTGKQMINEASEVGNELEITRAEMDRFATRSHQLAAKATDEGKLADEIVSVTVKSRKSETVFEVDEAIRPDTDIETLAKLRAIGGDDATHTAGNAPGVNDGASAVVVTSEEWAEANGKEPIATILSYGSIADDYAYLARTPAKAARQALERAGKTTADVDLWEFNEAFASVAINSIRMLEIDEEKVNVNGGAIALGHPIGASGGRIIGTLIHELLRRGGGLGCAAICSGGGQGDAILIQV